MHLLRRLYWLLVRLPVVGLFVRRFGVALRERSRHGLPDHVGQMVEVHNHVLYTIADDMLNVREALDQAVDGGRLLDDVDARLSALEDSLADVREQVRELALRLAEEPTPQFDTSDG